jgi:hypothetical protein
VFVGGVGAFFHGDATDMERNLSGRMAGLPDSALLFCGCVPLLISSALYVWCWHHIGRLMHSASGP